MWTFLKSYLFILEKHLILNMKIIINQRLCHLLLCVIAHNNLLLLLILFSIGLHIEIGFQEKISAVPANFPVNSSWMPIMNILIVNVSHDLEGPLFLFLQEAKNSAD